MRALYRSGRHRFVTCPRLGPVLKCQNVGVKRWLPWLVLPTAACMGVWTSRSTTSTMFLDTDTAVLLEAVRQRSDPWSWFAGDWPLGNHFYRPVSTLSFEFDERLHSGSGIGFGTTQALLPCLCVFLLFWFVREMTGRPWMAGLSSFLFGAWTAGWPVADLVSPACWVMAALCWIGPLRNGKAGFAASLVASTGLVFLATLWRPVEPFDSRIVAWLPGRTASVMTVFALLAMAAWSRFNRVAHDPQPGVPAPTDLPTTRGTEQVTSGSRSTAWVWAILALVAVALALGSYEQAVMLPAVLVLVSLWHRQRGRRVDWVWHVGPWAVLVGYLVLRASVLPAGVSNYQDQQLRTGPGVALALADYALPLWNWGRSVLSSFTDLAIMLFAPFWISVALVIGNVASWIVAKRWDAAAALAPWAMSVVAFLPMAWLHTFGHYHFWPSALRAVYACGLTGLVAKAVVSAVSLRERQAPQRQSPAPGSLPRP